MLWLVATSEGELAPVLKPLNQEPLGCEQILSRWIPYWSRLEDEVGKR
jgi:hypothetical protein